MEFNTSYANNEFQEDYFPMSLHEEPRVEKIEQPIVSPGEIGMSVTEGSRFGNLIQTAQGAIKKGVGVIELSTGQGGSQEPVGVENYGKDARQALRELSKVNQVKFSSVHAPSNIGNLSGFDPRQGFVDESRKNTSEEIKKAIDFAADLGGAGVVIHTNEFQRSISSQDWAKDDKGNYMFMGYNEEPGRAMTYMVDQRTGRIMQDIRRSSIIREPVYKKAGMDWDGGETPHDYTDSNGHYVKKGDLIDQDGNYLDPNKPEHLFLRVPKWDNKGTRFTSQPLSWNEIEERTIEVNKSRQEQGLEKLRPEEVAFRIQMETQMLQYRGSSLYHGRMYKSEIKRYDALKKALEKAKRLEKEMGPERAWQLMEDDMPRVGHITQKYAERERRLPSELIAEELEEARHSMKYTHEASSSADAKADEIEDTIKHVVPVDKYAMEQSAKTAAEAGIHAWIESRENPHSQRNSFVAMENIFPDQGYGSHPSELKQLVFNGRDKMVQMLTEKKIKDPYGRITKTGDLIDVDNPWYQPNLSKKEAEKVASEHIKATLDVQHLGMWRKHFVPKPGESKADTDKRFNKWYIDQVEDLAESGVVGHIHLVDAMGGGHHHLPAGQGILPVVDAVRRLKEKGYGGMIVSEAYGEEGFGQGRQITETWKAFGAPIYSTRFSQHAFGPRFGQVHQSYFGANQPPFYFFGQSYVPSNDWTLWSQVQLE